MARKYTLLRKFQSKRTHICPGAIQGHEVVLSFGKNKGKPIKQVDDAYLEWMQATLGSSWWRTLASEILEDRRQQYEIYRKTMLIELKECSISRNLSRGKEIHAEAVKSGNETCIYVATALVNMYAKCGSMVDAHQVLNCITHPDVVAWNALISGYAENGMGVTALDLFARMKVEGCLPDSITFITALKACTSLAKQDDVSVAKCRELGRQIHSEIGHHCNPFLQSSLIDMYANCGSMGEARQVFEDTKHPDVVLWNVLIFGYAENREGVTALHLFARMRSQGCVPNSTTLVALLKAYASIALEQDKKGRTECKERGKQIHSIIGVHSSICVLNILIDMYAKCGSMFDARQVFDSIQHPDVVSWNTIISGYAQNGDGDTALDQFARMKSQGLAPSSITFLAAIKACKCLAQKGRPNHKERGKQLHMELGSLANNKVQSTLIDMYSKCGSMAEAQKIFEGMKYPDVVSWNALILGYVDNREGVLAISMFEKMRSQGFAPNSVTFVAALKAFGLLAAFEAGCNIHAEIHAAIDGGTERNARILVNCLVSFYSKCGCMVEAQKIFDLHPKTRNLITWNALLAGYSHLGDYKSVFRLFERMQDADFHPDGITFLCILACCSHAGHVQKANELFEAMCTNYGISPSVEHYNCMVDILGRSSNLDDAITLLQRIPCLANDVTWMNWTIAEQCRLTEKPQK